MTNKDKTTVLETDGDLIQAIETMTMPTTRTQVTPPSPHENKLKAPSTCKIASFLTAYEKWVENHTGLARNIEATLYIAPQLIPKSVLEPEIAAQCSYSFVGLLHLYHDYVLWKKQENNYVESPIKQCQKLTRLVRMPLSLIMHVQVLAEVVARKAGGDVGKWRLIVWVEVVKGVLRLMLLSQQRHVMLISGGKYKGIESASRLSAFTRFKKTKQPGARTGKTFGKVTTASKPEPLTKTSDDKDLKTMAFEDATCDVAEASREDLLVAGEICHILRPVMYALLRRRRSETSWTPVVVSLLMELSGLALSAAAVKPTEPMKAVFINKAGDEIAARKMALLLYLLRDPVFATVTKPVVEKSADILDYVPGVGKLFRFGTTAILDYYHQFHFYTSAS
ncbi:unnamed protein product [Peronospora belbahrii]|uniref:Peroxisomal membrane protein PEX16 n=1 Tax=Peronospora belbahrii TaxID=622444 RepID=A0AAU9LDK1_9STRA|nr:unnamed protein product [Peronospora belbahrii]